MKKYCLVMMLACLLSGCGAQETFETISDELISPVMAQPKQISVRLPQDAVTPVLESDTRQLYISEDYEITVETLSGGDLRATVQAISGYEPEQLTILETQHDGITRHEFVWVSMGEQGEQLGRGVILDDGEYHYCLSALRSARDTEKTQVVWSDVFCSFTLT